ncbi:DUF2971 domain-containing protein [Sphingomonas corticis]|uniref:DUF2971 domain-containing protein n=1 Tax=Sphingomonas corticis TaxID=2722791 RepID=A0ABX1CQP8_9SPHN|nr:DUF2971 domain-containing protein [Sphingomonas corticis]NJR80264.1 DUF2971 domain-containing protein [Sphingomonas corticis]
MLHKFVGGDDAAILDVMDKVLTGSLKFASAAHFNDPFEFKFKSVAPSRDRFDAWHRQHHPERSAAELENAWAAFAGPAADWNTSYAPRANVLSRLFVLCLVERWDSHLMWSHYTNAHRGFAVVYKPEVIDTLAASADHVGSGHVSYRAEPPELRWFEASPGEMLGPILFTKPTAWSYEKELRIVRAGEPAGAIFVTVDPSLISGVILGARAPASLIAKAIAARRSRPDLRVQQVSSGGGYDLTLVEVDENLKRANHIL